MTTIIDLAPQTAQMVHSIATQQGQSVEQFILSIVDEKLSQIDKTHEELELLAEQDGLNSDGLPPISESALQAIYDDLDQEPQPNPRLQALMAKYGGLNV